MTFTLFNALSGSSQVGTTCTNSATDVSNGLFTITLDFGNQFPGADRWLEIGVRTNRSGVFTTLTPRQKLTPTPYAVFANTASNLSGTLPAAQISGTVPSADLSGNYTGPVTFNNGADRISGNGTGLTNVNAATLDGLSAAGFCQTSGNAGTTPGVNFVGTTDDKPLDFYVNNVRALRLVLRTDAMGAYSTAPNVIGGCAANQVSSGVLGEGPWAAAAEMTDSEPACQIQLRRILAR